MESIPLGLIPLVTIGVVAAVIILIIIYISRYNKCGPDEVLVISGRKRARKGEVVGYRILKGGGTFVWPILERVDKLSLENMTLEVRCEDVYTAEGVPITVDGVAVVKIKGDDESISTAAEQFLDKETTEIEGIATRTLEGHLRAILAKLTVEEIYQDREKFAQNVQDVAATDLSNMGMSIIAFTIKDVHDKGGYLNALGVKRTSQVKRDARIGKAEAEKNAMIKSAIANQEAEIGKLKAETDIAASKRDYEIKKAEYSQEVNLKKAQAELAGELQKFITSQDVKKEEVGVAIVEKKTQIDVAEKEVMRMQKELQAKIEKQAEAEKYMVEKRAAAEKYKLEAIGMGAAEAIRIAGLAEAEAERVKGMAEAEVIEAQGAAEAEAMVKKAEAWKSYNRAAIAETLIGKLPEITKAVAEPLAKTEKIIMVSSGESARITSNAAKILSQLPPVIESLSGVSLKELVDKIPGIKTLTEEEKEM
ncbi:flotillin family protein [Candidatus Poribacteria bacterium]|nr:flotillin family protein [Candidatus Poribacteria bacterium]